VLTNVPWQSFAWRSIYRQEKEIIKEKVKLKKSTVRDRDGKSKIKRQIDAEGSSRRKERAERERKRNI
jgi:hypothetical protein